MISGSLQRFFKAKYSRADVSKLIKALIYTTVMTTVLAVFFSQIFVLNISSSSAHYGFFRLPLMFYSTELKKGDWVLFMPEFKTQGEYLPQSKVPFAKQIVGIAGDKIEVSEHRIVTVGGALVGKAKTHTQLGRKVEPISPAIIPNDYIFVAGTSSNSRDSRYQEVGLIAVNSIDAILWPLPEIPLLGVTNARFIELVEAAENFTLAIQKEGLP